VRQRCKQETTPTQHASVDWLSKIGCPRSRVPLWTQVERAHCGALLRADQDVAATREGTMRNQVGRAAILAIILMNIHEMTRG